MGGGRPTGAEEGSSSGRDGLLSESKGGDTCTYRWTLHSCLRAAGTVYESINQSINHYPTWTIQNPALAPGMRKTAAGSGSRAPRAKWLLGRVVAFPDPAQSFVGSPIRIPERTICLFICSGEKPARKAKVRVQFRGLRTQIPETKGLALGSKVSVLGACQQPTRLI
jgi:hypothetical protein